METTPLQEHIEDIENTLSLRDILDIFIFNWKWFVISAIICLAIGRLYLATQPNIYQRSAVMLVKDDSNTPHSSSSRGKGTDALMQLNGVMMGSSVKNEVYILHSFQLAQEVAKDLQLDVMYSIRKGLRNISLYKNRPFTVDFITEFTVPANFKLTIDSERGGTITDVKYGIPMEKSDFTAKVEWGKVVNTPFGNFVVTPIEGLFDEFVGMTLGVQRLSVEDGQAVLRHQR